MKSLKYAALALGGLAFATIPAYLYFGFIEEKPLNLLPAGALAALLAAALLIAWKFDLFREAEPRLTIDQELQAVTISPQQRGILVAATLHNRSNRARDGLTLTCVLARIAPMTNQEVEKIIAAAGPGNDYPWPPITPETDPEEPLPARIRPEQRITRHFLFQIPAEVTALKVTTTLRRPRPYDPPVSPRQPESWQQVSFHYLEKQPTAPGGEQRSP